MIVTSDFIKKVILQKGYKSVNEFITKNDFKQRAVLYAFERNSWTREMLLKIGNALGVDLSRFENAKLGEKRDVE